jgi:hypothetical protein
MVELKKKQKIDNIDYLLFYLEKEIKLRELDNESYMYRFPDGVLVYERDILVDIKNHVELSKQDNK